MFIADTSDTEYQLRFFLSEIDAVRILQEYNAGFLYGALRLTGTVRNGNAMPIYVVISFSRSCIAGI